MPLQDPADASRLRRQDESDLAPMHMLHWARWTPGSAPEGMALSGFWPNTTEVTYSCDVDDRLIEG